MRRVLLLAVATGALCLYWDRVGRQEESAPEPAARAALEAEATSDVRLAERLLAGRAEARGPAPDTATAAVGTGPGVLFNVSPLDLTRFPFVSVAPEQVEDRVAATAPLPLPVLRSDLVGTVGPYGVRDPASAGSVRWLGVAQVIPGTLEQTTPLPKPQEETQAPPTTAVRGVVVGEDGRPIEGAEVILYSSFYLRQAFYDHRVRQIGRVVTGADGVFDVRPIALDTVHFGAQGQVLVTVRHPHLADLVAQPLPAIVPGRESDVGRLVLPVAGATIRGVILDLAGKPVVGAVVRVSGALNPVEYDKTERMVVLGECPAAMTDAEGAYVLADFAPGVHEISIHVRIDCVTHVSERWEGEREWSPRVQAGNGVRGRVVDPDGAPVEAAVVAGGGNWTPTNADGTFWLDNVQVGPLTLEVAHHAWHTVSVPAVPTDAEEITVAMQRRLSLVTLTVVDAASAPVPLVAIDWIWPPGQGPGLFVPDSRYWHDPAGVFRVVVPERATGATVSDAKGARHAMAPEELLDGAALQVALVVPDEGR